MNQPLDIPYDTEMQQIQEVHRTLQERFSTGRHNYHAVEREIRERFGAIGFKVEINWHQFAKNGTVFDPDEALMPEITIVGKTSPETEFDHERMQHEVRRDLLGIGDSGVIKTDTQTVADFEARHKKGHC